MSSQAISEPVASDTSQQRLACIHLKMGEKSLVISISKLVQNFMNLGSTGKNDEPSMDLNAKGENSDSLLISFSELNENSFDPIDSSEDPLHSRAQKPSRVSVDLANETPQAVLITNSNAASSQVSVCCVKQYSLGSSQAANKPASHGRYCQNPTYVNVNPGDEST